MKRINRLMLSPSPAKQIPDRSLNEIALSVLQFGCEVFASSAYRDIFCDERIIFTDSDIPEGGVDMVLVLGGDGSIIDAARKLGDCDVPIAGMNFGRLGYLADLNPGEPEVLFNMLSGEFKVERRIMLDVEIEQDGKTVRGDYPALNDVVLSNGPFSRMLTFELYSDGYIAENIRADGLIVSTPTGSTAYSMSAGGPVVDPALDCFIATVLCPHSLRNRPVVFGGDSVLELRRMNARGNEIYLTVDGRDIIKLSEDAAVRLRRSEKTVRLVRVREGSFMTILQDKII